MRRLVVSVLAVAGLVLVLPGVAAAAEERLPGIDVSQWQETIDWSAAAGSGRVAFAIMRADRGNDYVDPWYATNLAGATAAGVVVGAYHFATVSATPADDAVREADHFLATARNAPGDILPVLDIEDSGGLPPAQLEDWVRAWVQRVRSTLGVRPMLYSSPNFWTTAMGDTTWFAERGYPLWIAHWGVSEPRLPAANWAGRGWSVWQWTSTGTVPGIEGNVDRDLLNGTDLSAIRIASLTVAPGAGGTVRGPKIACGGSQGRCGRLANPGEVITLTATPDPDAVFLGWSGACAGTVGPVCTLTMSGDVATAPEFGYPVTVTTSGTGAGTVTSSPAGIECGTTCGASFPAGSTVTLSATPDSASGIGAWGGACEAAGSGSDCVLTVDGPASADARFDAEVRLEEDGEGTAYRWGTAKASWALGGSYRVERRAGAALTFGFKGNAATVTLVEGPAMGKAKVTVDGTGVAKVDGYAATLGPRAIRLTGFGPGAHTLTVMVTGSRRPAATGTRVGVDALRWGGRDRPDPPPSTATWGSIADADASGGAAVTTDVAGATASLRFTGTGCTWITARGPQMGRADVYIDGDLVKRVDLFGSAEKLGVARTFGGLDDGPHRIEVVVRGTHAPDAKGPSIVVDGWIVR